MWLVGEGSIGIEVEHGEVHGMLGDHCHSDVLLLHALLDGVGVDVLSNLLWCLLLLLDAGLGDLLSGLSGGWVLGEGVQEAGEGR